jgi:hypothetical protein
MPERILGRKPGDICSICKTGHLVARFQGQHNCNPRIGGGPGPFPSLHHLVCSGCGGWYESSTHGNLNTLLGAQLKKFVPQGMPPEQCPQCAEPVAEYVLSTGYSVYRYPGDDDPHAKKLLYCDGCVLLLWTFPSRLEEIAERARETQKTGSKTPR